MLVRRGCHTDPGDEVAAAYDAPFPSEAAKAGARAFPGLIPQTPDAPGAAAGRRVLAALRERPAADADAVGRRRTRCCRRRSARRSRARSGSPRPAVIGEAPATSCRRTRAAASARDRRLARLGLGGRASSARRPRPRPRPPRRPARSRGARLVGRAGALVGAQQRRSAFIARPSASRARRGGSARRADEAGRALRHEDVEARVPAAPSTIGVGDLLGRRRA